MKHNGKIIFTVMTFLFIFVAGDLSIAQNQKAGQENASGEKKAGSPKISFLELSHDFGKALQGSKLEHTFGFRNTGQSVLIIEKVKAG
jgi:hypothetical protein